MVAFLAFLFLPLIVVAVFAFNNAPYPAPPWRGFTLDWFLGDATGRVGLFGDGELLGSIWTSCVVAFWVTLLSVLIGTSNAFLIERGRFFGKQALSILMLAPLVIPGVILGISILAFASRVAQFVDDRSESTGTSCVPACRWSCAASSPTSPPSRRSPSARACAASTARSRRPP